MIVTIDRFEGEFAVVETEEGNMVNLSKILVPDAHEGDVVTIEINKELTEIRKDEVKELMKNLFE